MKRSEYVLLFLLYLLLYFQVGVFLRWTIHYVASLDKGLGW